MHTDPDLASLADNPTARADIRDDWTFEMTGLNGPRRLTLARAPADWMLDGMTLDGVDVADSALPFGTDARSLSNVEVRMTRRLTELSGTIARTGKSPSTTGVVAFAIDRSAWFFGSRRVAFARPDADGVFSMSKLPPGSYEVAAFDEEDVPDPSTAEDASELLRTLQPRATPVNIAPGQHQIITVPPPPR